MNNSEREMFEDVLSTALKLSVANCEKQETFNINYNKWIFSEQN